MTTIKIPFTKVWYNAVDYDLEGISNYILGKEQSVYTRYNEKKPGVKMFCGFYLPPFQRSEVWDIDRKIKLIESLFCEINIGDLMFVSNYDCPEIDGWLIDGKQRLTAIRDFVKGEFSVFDGQVSYNNMTEVELAFSGKDPLNAPKKAHLIWKRSFLHFKRIEQVTDVETLKELYNRLNFGGMPHKESERAI